MGSYKRFVGIFVLIFLVASIPFMLGYGIVIDFQREVHPFWIMLLYIKEGFLYNFIEKALLSFAISASVYFYLHKCKRN
ncbi:hypothetical protein [Brevibacillus sp. SAFN-007a]|uniref:hypothetical protein n=1 Tax=Brevibacillus sp. SAFN-007a TaxID=3436862 RepID=UPI003F7D48D2